MRILNELKKHNPELLDKDRLLAISKSDMLDDELKEEIAADLPEGVETLPLLPPSGKACPSLIQRALP